MSYTYKSCCTIILSHSCSCIATWWTYSWWRCIKSIRANLFCNCICCWWSHCCSDFTCYISSWIGCISSSPTWITSCYICFISCCQSCCWFSSCFISNSNITSITCNSVNLCSISCCINIRT